MSLAEQALADPLYCRTKKSNVPSIRVLSSHGRVLGISRDVDAIIENVCRVGDEVVPLWGIAQVQRANGTPIQTNNAKQNRAEDKSVLCVQIVPDLTITVQSAASINVHVLTTELEEGRCILEDLLESIRLPVIGIVGELDGSLDIC